MLAGSACSTYTSSTDPDDMGSGWALSDTKSGTGTTNSPDVAEANNNATFDNPDAKDTKVPTDSAVVMPAAKDSANTKPKASTSAPVRVSTGQQDQ